MVSPGQRTEREALGSGGKWAPRTSSGARKVHRVGITKGLSGWGIRVGWSVPLGYRCAAWHHDTICKNLTVRLLGDASADAEALARAEGLDLNETIKQALVEAVERHRSNPTFKSRLARIIQEDRELRGCFAR